MAKSRKSPQAAAFNIVIIAQAGRWQYEAALFAASLRHFAPKFQGRLFIAEPQPNDRWSRDPRINDPALRGFFADLGAEILQFENHVFGETYPHGNKIEALLALPEGKPFVFFDSDTLILDDIADVALNFSKPSALWAAEGTWPIPQLYGPGYHEIWQALYALAGLDVADVMDRRQPQEFWRRYPYFNAGFFYGPCPVAFGRKFRDIACAIRDCDLPQLAAQSLDPWLDQAALPVAIAALGGAPDLIPDGVIDGSHSCHYRFIPLLYATRPDRVVEALEQVCAPKEIKRVLKAHKPFQQLIYQGKGHAARALFDRANLPRKEQVIRNTLKRENLWLR